MRSLNWFLWTNKKNTPENKCPNFHYTPSSTPETTPPHNIPPRDCCQPICFPLLDKALSSSIPHAPLLPAASSTLRSTSRCPKQEKAATLILLLMQPASMDR